MHQLVLFEILDNVTYMVGSFLWECVRSRYLTDVNQTVEGEGTCRLSGPAEENHYPFCSWNLHQPISLYTATNVT
uniref:Uncharacterized protein n=1 Tax=Anguilla anguilla TaxID=7936 RepID=A0A0E9XJ20_ANGAN